MNPTDRSGASKRLAAQGDATLRPGLYLVATPIGNAEDITLRALRILRDANAVLCEDTRRSAKLFSMHGLANTLIAYHEHSAARLRPEILRRLRGGEALALISDAGAPLVSDPGFKLVRACLDEGLHVEAVPGPSAVITALQLSGLPSDRFLFAGFLPAKAAARRQAIEALKAVPASLILFESARRLPATLQVLAQVLGPRPACVARELTKLYEETQRGSLEGLAAHYEREGPPKGEVTIVIGPPAEEDALSDDQVDALLRDALANSSLKQAAAEVAAATGRSKRALYQRALALKAT